MSSHQVPAVMLLLPFLVLLHSCTSDQECGISNALEKELGNKVDREMGESDSDGGGNRIINGKDAPTNSFPWHAQLALIYRTRNGPRSSTCGGAIVEPLYVLTAAHCVEGADEMKEVWLGRHDRQSGGSSYKVAHFIIHPEREKGHGSTEAHDIAMIKLTKAISYSTSILPVCLPGPSSSPEAGSKVVVSGWGRTNSGAQNDNVEIFPSTLQYVLLDVIPMAKCKEFHAAKAPKPHEGSTFCTLTPGKDHCKRE